jgi:hypothetical protein
MTFNLASALVAEDSPGLTGRQLLQALENIEHHHARWPLVGFHHQSAISR